jgi:CRP/FNR family transcriptional regulator, anaerobic regulatory protein
MPGSASAIQELMNQAYTARTVLLERFPVFAQIAPSQLDELLAAAPLQRASAGSVLFEPNQPCEGFPLVLEGSVKVVKTSPAGREIVLYRVSPGEGCILSGGCLLGQHDYAARGVAESDVTLLRIPPVQFQDLMVTFEPFRRFVFDLYGARLAEMMELIDEVAFRKLDARLARLLVQRGPALETTHQMLADELGSVRVFVSRLLRNFEERGWVKLERERIEVVDAKGLLEFARQ